MAQFQFLEWLLLWLIEIEQFTFQWDKGNLTKSVSKHEVLPSEVEEVFNRRMAMPLGVQVFPVNDEERLGIVGKTGSNRTLMICFTLRDGKVRPISSRPANEKERNSYEAFLREIT